MDTRQGPRIRFIHPPSASLFERILFALLGLVILIAAFFFIGIALIAGAVLACVILIRFWWLKRKLSSEAPDQVVEGEFSVVETVITDQRTPPER
jgi:Zn-dependent membrane protease YugP